MALEAPTELHTHGRSNLETKLQISEHWNL
ncbi:uncharacterized protein G2W53_033816 [Senna tora]|uniref:Uncharacterized protein n=1 Tax=Senna tora TaxID=362788 RepID=A0A834W7B6_9FABA|nr:uncharacterized protein G2W53_033816 [Senna tora]